MKTVVEIKESCKDQRIIERARHNRALLYNALGKIEHCG